MVFQGTRFCTYHRYCHWCYWVVVIHLVLTNGVESTFSLLYDIYRRKNVLMYTLLTTHLQEHTIWTVCISMMLCVWYLHSCSDYYMWKTLARVHNWCNRVHSIHSIMNSQLLKIAECHSVLFPYLPHAVVPLVPVVISVAIDPDFLISKGSEGEERL